MNLDPAAARSLFSTARAVRLATVAPDGRPHLVPICFALDGDALVSAVDGKPKRDARLQRLANIASEPRVCVLADAYDEDWSRLWWARADGRAQVVPPDDPRHAPLVALLVARYAQYQEAPPAGPAIVVEVERWTGWRGGG